jgi:hypothetical protein
LADTKKGLASPAWERGRDRRESEPGPDGQGVEGDGYGRESRCVLLSPAPPFSRLIGVRFFEEEEEGIVADDGGF